MLKIQKHFCQSVGTRYTMGRLVIWVHFLHEWLVLWPGSIEILKPNGLAYYREDDGHDGYPLEMLAYHLRLHVDAWSEATWGEAFALYLRKYSDWLGGMALGAMFVTMVFFAVMHQDVDYD